MIGHPEPKRLLDDALSESEFREVVDELFGFVFDAIRELADGNTKMADVIARASILRRIGRRIK